jgi:hypothetical protein
MIQEQIKIHDQQTIELKLEFSISKMTSRKDRFFVNIYLFLPYTLDVNKHNFARQDFYDSLKTYIRLTTPFFLLQNIVKEKNSPYAILSKSAKNFIASPDEKKKGNFDFQLKRFCSIFGTSLRHSTNHILNATINTDRKDLISDFIDQVQQIREAFKSLRPTINVSLKSNEIFDVYQLADEYQSLLVEKHIFILIDEFDNENNNIEKTQLTKLNDLVLQEMTYREEREYQSIAKTHSSNEDILYRSSQLKKFIESNLFLNTDTKEDGVFFEQIIFGFAAGIAMVFATAVAFASQLMYGNLTLPFFVALVVSYIFKDRIKELVRLKLNKRQYRYFYDFKTNIYDQKNKKIGALKESFLFVKHKHLSELILAARSKMRSTDISIESLGEKIIRYRNKINIFKNIVEEPDDFTGFTEILRLNISDFTKKMDDPEKEIFVRTKNGFKKSNADRVYHLNMILTYSDRKDKIFRLYKLIVSRNGIKRIEQINFEKELE